MIYLLNFNITYIITLLHVSTLMSHLQAQISRPIVHIALQFLCLTVFCRTIAIGIPFCFTKSESMSIWY